jgi:hypothetical protein
MSTDQETHRTTNDPPGQGESESPDYIARSVAAKTHWLQRVLSPWAQRWLASGVENAAPTGEQHSPAALTVGNTRQLVGRVQRLVERGTVWRPEAVSLQPAMVDGFAGSIVNRFPDTGAKYELRPAETGPAQAADLVLAGTGEPTPASAQPRGQSFQPFTSLAEFRKAIEDKQRAPGGGPTAAEPPRAGQPAQPQVQRMPAEPPKARRLARTLPPGSRPVSRVEEVLPGVEATPTAETSLQTQAEPQTPPAVGMEPPPLPAVQRRATEAAPVPTQEAPPAEASSLPPVQRQLEPGPALTLEEEAAPAPPSVGVEPPRPSAGREVTPPAVQRRTAEVMPAPEQPYGTEEAPPAAVTPPAGREMPVVQRRVEPDLPPAPAGEPPAAEARPPGPPSALETRPIQRRVAEEAPTQAPTVAEAGPPAQVEASRSALPPVQRKMVEEAPAQPPAHAGEAPQGGPDMPLVQRRGAEAAPSPAQLPHEQEDEQEAPPAAEAGSSGQPDVPPVQRQVADEAPALAPAHAGQERPAAPPGGLDMPLVQRQGPEVESPATPPAIEAAPPGRPERPLVQRQTSVAAPPPAQQPPEEEAAPSVPPDVEETAPAGPEMPLAQRQVAEASPPIPAQPPRQEEAPPAAHEHKEGEPLVPVSEAAPPHEGTAAESPVAPAASEAPPRQAPEMPLVQRQPAGARPDKEEKEEVSPTAEAKPPSPPAGGPELPLVQRSPREGIPQAETGPAQVHGPAADLEGEVMARAASWTHLPLIEPPPPAQAEAIRTKPVEQTAILPQARVQAYPEGSPEPSALTPSRPETPPKPGQRPPAGGLPAQTGWTWAAATELPLPPPLQRSVAPARTASTTWIQRQPEAAAPSPVVTPRPERIVQREGEEPPSQPTAGEGTSPAVTPPQPTEGESAPPNLDSLARQIYPLIKRMLAVERERKWGR